MLEGEGSVSLDSVKSTSFRIAPNKLELLERRMTSASTLQAAARNSPTTGFESQNSFAERSFPVDFDVDSEDSQNIQYSDEEILDDTAEQVVVPVEPIKEESAPSSGKKRRFSKEEDEILLGAVKSMGPNVNWENVVQQHNLNRTAKQVQLRFKRIRAQTPVKDDTMGKYVPRNNSFSEIHHSARVETPPCTARIAVPPRTPLELHLSSESTPNGEADAVISRMNCGEKGDAMNENSSVINQLQQRVVELEKELEQQQKSLEMLEEDKNDALMEMMRVQEEDRRNYMHRESAIREWLVERLRAQAKEEAHVSQEHARSACMRLGFFMAQRVGTSIQEMWTDGTAFIELREKQEALMARREALEPKKRGKGGKNVNREDENEDDVHRLVMAALKRDETEWEKEAEMLERDKNLHIRELKRLADEVSSRYKDFPLLHGRYLLQKMLGRGGFAEVHKAFDLTNLKEVAVKIHELNSHWSEEKKKNYIKHSCREYNIHRALCHPRVVKLMDVFEIDDSAFATVLEYVEGSDLDFYLKQRKLLGEKEARSIMIQLFSALNYLSSQKNSIIHYDLKPANILFHNQGEIKLTDFGLSKVMESQDSSGAMELTSQGTGTYWYLPPECFAAGSSAPRISSKVDVWSAGVIFYQMLYGVRPFGHDKSQYSLAAENIIVNATSVSFPATPKISNECKDFIRSCLTHRISERLSVKEAYDHAYLNSKK